MAYILIGSIIGMLFGFILGRLLSSKDLQSRVIEMQSKLASADATVAELRKQIEKAEEDFEHLRFQMSNDKEARVKAETEKEELLRLLETEKKLLSEAEEKLTNTFKALAGETLNENRNAFLALAKETFEKILVEAKGDLGQRQEAINGLVKPLSESLQKFDEQIRQLETKRQEAYIGLKTHLDGLATSQEKLQREATNLAVAMRNPQVRGRWGELTLQRVMELGGLSEHYVFTQQLNVSSEEGRFRPDLIISLPNDRIVIVDSKAPLDAYLEAVSASSEVERKAALERHAQQMRTHIGILSGKNYLDLDEFRDKTPEFVVMFIPGESFFAAALDTDRGLIEDAIEKRILIATPTTLISLIRTVAYDWRQQSIAKNAQSISDLGRDLYDRLKILANHISNIGAGLDKANQSYNSAIGSVESRVLSAARRFKEFGAVVGEEIPVLKAVEIPTRKFSSPELKD